MKPQFINISLDGTKTIQIKNVEQSYLNTPFHFHHLCELVWIEKSSGKRIIGDNIDNFSDGDLVLMGPHLPHIWQNDGLFFEGVQERKVKSTVIYFPPDFLLNLTDESNIIQPIQELVKRSYRGLFFYGETKKTVTSILSKIAKEASLRKIVYFLELIHQLSLSEEYNYISSITYQNLYDEKDAGRIDKVYQFLIQNFHRDISLTEVSDLCYLTPNAFCRFFKSRTNKSFTQFLNELRIGHAAKLLHDETYSVSDICYLSGYNNLVNFNKFFKAIHKTTPSEYRRILAASK